MSVLKIKDIMTREVKTLAGTATISDAQAALKQHDIRHLPVVDGSNRLIGLMTHRGLLTKIIELQAPPHDDTTLAIPIEHIMTTAVTTAAPHDPVLAAARVMLDNKFGCLPVVDGGTLVGIVAESDFVGIVARELALPR